MYTLPAPLSQGIELIPSSSLNALLGPYPALPSSREIAHIHMVTSPTEVRCLCTNVNVMILATENAGHHVPHFSSVVLRNNVDLKNCLYFLSFSVVVLSLPLSLLRSSTSLAFDSILPPDYTGAQTKTNDRKPPVSQTAFTQQSHPPSCRRSVHRNTRRCTRDRLEHYIAGPCTPNSRSSATAAHA